MSLPGLCDIAMGHSKKDSHSLLTQEISAAQGESGGKCTSDNSIMLGHVEKY